MKKFTFIFIILFVFISNTVALEEFYLARKVPGMHIGTINKENVYHNGVPYMIRRNSDNSLVYCLDQQNPNISGYYDENIDNNILNLSEEQINKINLYAYYGYEYKNHINIHWYGVAQFMIWKTLNYRDVFFTDTAYGNRMNYYSDEIKELTNLVNKHNELPSFSNDSFNYTVNKTYEIEDLNEVLNYYEIKNSNIESKIENNTLYINTKEDGTYEIEFIRKSPIDRDYILYYNNESQPLIYPGRIKDVEFKINIEVKSGSVTINNFDSENKNRDFASLEGTVYGLYDDKELITTIKTDFSNVGYLDKLPYGKYFVKQLTPGLGYKLDNNVYEINIDENNKDIIINSYNEVIKGDLLINKYYGNKNDYKLEEDAVFEIYDINDKLIGDYKTKEGIINTKLDYGYYYVIQKEGKDGYKFVDKFNLSIKEQKEYTFDLYNEKEEILVVEVPNTKKYDYSKFISVFLIILGLTFIFKSKKKTT